MEGEEEARGKGMIFFPSFSRRQLEIMSARKMTAAMGMVTAMTFFPRPLCVHACMGRVCGGVGVVWDGRGRPLSRKNKKP